MSATFLNCQLNLRRYQDSNSGPCRDTQTTSRTSWQPQEHCILHSCRKQLDGRLLSLGSRVRVAVTLCGFRGGRNEVWVGFSRSFYRFPLAQISFHHFSTFISLISCHKNANRYRNPYLSEYQHAKQNPYGIMHQPNI